MKNKPNCWEIKNCGRGPGEWHVPGEELCPAAIDTTLDGINGGHNGGRFCWTTAGTLCRGAVSGSFARKIDTCMHCIVFHLVRCQEGDQCVLSTTTGTVAELIQGWQKRHAESADSAAGAISQPAMRGRKDTTCRVKPGAGVLFPSDEG